MHTGKYTRRLHAEHATSFTCEYGAYPQTVNRVVFDCASEPRYLHSPALATGQPQPGDRRSL
jgi:hypothetical protein